MRFATDLESTGGGLRQVRDNLADLESTGGGLRQVRDDLADLEIQVGV